MVAGGPSEASDHRSGARRNTDPGQGSRSKYQAARHPSATAAAVVNNWGGDVPVVSRFAATTGYRTSHLRRLSPLRSLRIDLTARQL